MPFHRKFELVVERLSHTIYIKLRILDSTWNLSINISNMKTSPVLGLIASFAFVAIASPAASSEDQLAARDPIICIGCINTPENCQKASEPDGCVVGTPGLF